MAPAQFRLAASRCPLIEFMFTQEKQATCSNYAYVEPKPRSLANRFTDCRVDTLGNDAAAA